METERKVKIASWGSLAGSLAVLALELHGPAFIETLPEGVRLVAGAALVMLLTYFGGRQARSRPNELAPSTLEAARIKLRSGGAAV